MIHKTNSIHSNKLLTNFSHFDSFFICTVQYFHFLSIVFQFFIFSKTFKVHTDFIYSSLFLISRQFCSAYKMTQNFTFFFGKIWLLIKLFKYFLLNFNLIFFSLLRNFQISEIICFLYQLLQIIRVNASQYPKKKILFRGLSILWVIIHILNEMFIRANLWQYMFD